MVLPPPLAVAFRDDREDLRRLWAAPPEPKA